MKALLARHKFIYSFLFLVFAFVSPKIKAQTLSFSITPGLVCYASGGTNTVSAVTTGTFVGTNSYMWALQGPPSCTPSYNNAVPNGSIITINFPCCGTYTLVEFAYNGALLLGSYTNTFFVSCSPVMTVTGNSAFCAGGSTILYANGATSYTWANGPSTFSISLTPTVTTTYTVTGTTGFCTSTAIQTITVNPLPAISIGSFTSTICAGNTTTLFAGGANTYTWSGGITSTSLAISPSVTSSYTVLGTSAAGCTGVGVQGIIVNPVPTISITPGNSTVCPGVPVNLTAIGAQSYTWNIGAISPSITILPSVTSIYLVHGANSFGCIDTETAAVTIIPSVLAGFTFTNFFNGQVSFNNTSTNLSSNTTYTWNFGNGLISTSISPSTTYTSNGIYTVSLVASSGCGLSIITQTVNVTNLGPICASNFTYVTGPPGTYSFVSTSTGTSSSTTYSWSFGNGTPTYTASSIAGVFPPIQTYTNGTYLVILYIINSSPSFCIDSTAHVINVCALDPNFIHTQVSGNTVNFVSTSTNTLPTTTYSWNYGDGWSGSGSNSSHTYTIAGNYAVTLTAVNNFSCTSVKNINITVGNCNLGANFTHTVGLNGAVLFNNISSNTNTFTNYLWKFGDGVYSTLASPSHTYTNAGTYYVSLKIKDTLNSYCHDSLVQSISITGISCSADSYFNVVPTPTPHYWIATPAYPYNIIAATWDWGDGSYNDSLYCSHMYASPGTYTICLSVTVSCGANSSYCYTYAVNKSEQESSQIVYINIAPPALSTGIANIESENLSYVIYPNPNNGEFSLSLDINHHKNINLSVYSLIGENVYSSDEEIDSGSQAKIIRLNDVSNGIYFIRINTGDKIYTQKIIINR